MTKLTFKRQPAGLTLRSVSIVAGSGGLLDGFGLLTTGQSSLLLRPSSRRWRPVFQGKGRDVLKRMKSIGSYEFATLLVCVLWFVGCGGTLKGSSSHSKPPLTSADEASLKVLYAVNSIEATVRLAIEGAKEDQPECRLLAGCECATNPQGHRAWKALLIVASTFLCEIRPTSGFPLCIWKRVARLSSMSLIGPRRPSAEEWWCAL